MQKYSLNPNWISKKWFSFEREDNNKRSIRVLEAYLIASYPFLHVLSCDFIPS